MEKELILCDTNIFISWFKGDLETIARIQQPKHAIELIDQFRLSHGLLIPDAIIASTAITFNLKLFTYNLKDFQFIPGIQLYTCIEP